nr:GH36 C-terminal domain-containing protein [Cellulosilyticum ruminicola]
MVAKDKSEALVTFVQVLARPNRHSTRLTLKGLDPNGKYQDEATKRIYSGDTLMYAGLLMQGIHGDFTSKLIHLIKVEV